MTTLDQARDLQADHKAELSWAVRVSLAKALMTKDRVHADDIDVELPDEHANIIGSTCATFVRRGWMSEVDRRASKRRASNGRKSGVFAITELGRERFTPAREGGPADPGPGKATALNPAHGLPLNGSRLEATTDPEELDRREAAMEARLGEEVAEHGASWCECGGNEGQLLVEAAS